MSSSVRAATVAALVTFASSSAYAGETQGPGPALEVVPATPAPPARAATPAPVRRSRPAAPTTPITTPVTTAEAPEEPAPEDDRGPWAVSAMLGFSSNDLNLGFGIRAGRHAILPRLWVGGAFVYNVGHSASSTVMGVSSEASWSLYHFGPEAGWDFPIGASWLVRPYAGLGLAISNASASGPAVQVSGSDNRFVIWPGATATWLLPGSAFTLGGDLHLLTVPGGPALCFFATSGLRF